MEESEGEKKPASGILEKYQKLETLVNSNFSKVVDDSNIERSPGDAPRNLRIFFKDGSFMDIRVTRDGDYSFHWQEEEKVIRFDNAPHHTQIQTFPDHKHENDDVKESDLAEHPTIENKLSYALKYLKQEQLK